MFKGIQKIRKARWKENIGVKPSCHIQFMLAFTAFSKSLSWFGQPLSSGDKLPHIIYTFVFRIALCFESNYVVFHRYIWTNVSTSKIQCNAENACGTWLKSLH